MILLIDGYNLIFSGFAAPNNTRSDYLEKLRDNLVSQLKSYNLKKKHRIITVFDGDKTVSHYPQERESGNVRVVFSQGKSSADDLIINMTRSLLEEKPRRQDLSVVTSDRALAETLRNKRVKIISSQEFTAELAGQDKDSAPELSEEAPEKFTGLKPADVPKWLKLFGTTDDTDSTDD